MIARAERDMGAYISIIYKNQYYWIFDIQNLCILNNLLDIF